ncbi:MAG: GntR family transcriptional regulator, partial [Eubacterium sp.]|nr:GntR family transcriptional regulator [Eubacterium sp.]
MAWDLSGERPIYIQLVERISRQIASGAYKPGDKFPSVRELALEAAVNPNTMQRAMAALEADGLLITSRTSGRTVTEDMTLIESVKKNIAVSEYNSFY